VTVASAPVRGLNVMARISSGQRLGSELIEGIELAPGDGR
jgi:hypothetical protein